MKPLWLILGLGLVIPVARAQLVVFDVANLAQSVTNYGTLVSQLAKQAEQISHQLEQIRQMDDQLSRLGRMADFKNLIGFAEYKRSLTQLSKLESWADTLRLIDGVGLFGDTRGGIFSGVARDYLSFGGAAIPRDPERYKFAHEITAKVDNFIGVQTEVLGQRLQLKQAIAATSDAVQAASTEAEEMKLAAVLDAQFRQLGTLDSELGLTASEIQVKALQSAAMDQAEAKAEAEAREKLAQEEVRRIKRTFTPLYTSVLQYVREEPFVP